MRFVGGALLWVVAKFSGALAATSFSLAGVGWSGGFIARHYWEEAEAQIGVAFGVICLLVWAVSLGFSMALLWRGSLRHSRLADAAAIVLAVLSVITVAGLCILAIGVPEPPSEIPSPPWNRAYPRHSQRG